MDKETEDFEISQWKIEDDMQELDRQFDKLFDELDSRYSKPSPFDID